MFRILLNFMAELAMFWFVATQHCKPLRWLVKALSLPGNLLRALGVRLRPHGLYLSYVVRHKWHVYRAGRQLGVGRWQLALHDWSKFLPSEWFPYVAYFHGPDGAKNRAANSGKYYRIEDGSLAFNRAWLKHIHRQPHHWQNHLLLPDGNDGKPQALEMPVKYVREMVADWVGAGAAQGFRDVKGWYSRNKDRMVLHPEARFIVEALVDQFDYSKF